MEPRGLVRGRQEELKQDCHGLFMTLFACHLEITAVSDQLAVTVGDLPAPDPVQLEPVTSRLPAQSSSSPLRSTLKE
jgi:hypothetical protein